MNIYAECGENIYYIVRKKRLKIIIFYYISTKKQLASMPIPLNTCTECFGVLKDGDIIYNLNNTTTVCDICIKKFCRRCLGEFNRNTTRPCATCKKDISLKCTCAAFVPEDGEFCICRDCISNPDCPIPCAKCGAFLNDELAEETGITITSDNSQWVCNSCANRNQGEPVNEPLED